MDVSSLVSVVCCQAEVSVSGWSLVQRIPTECGVSECDREASYRRPRTTRAVHPLKRQGFFPLNLFKIKVNTGRNSFHVLIRHELPGPFEYVL